MTYHFTDYEELEELRKLNANQRQIIDNLRLEIKFLRKQVDNLTIDNNFLRAQIKIKNETYQKLKEDNNGKPKTKATTKNKM